MAYAQELFWTVVVIVIIVIVDQASTACAAADANCAVIDARGRRSYFAFFTGNPNCCPPASDNGVRYFTCNGLCGDASNVAACRSCCTDCCVRTTTTTNTTTVIETTTAFETTTVVPNTDTSPAPAITINNTPPVVDNAGEVLTATRSPRPGDWNKKQ